MNSAGSAGPYIALRARIHECSRHKVDREVFDAGTLVEVPAVRGCVMLVPCDDVPLALACARRSFAQHFQKVYQTCPVSERETKVLGEIIVTALRDEILTPDELRERLPPHLVCSLGEAGKMVGESSTLSFALRQLQVDGVAQRIAVDHRLGTNRYSYRLLPAGVSRKVVELSGSSGLLTDLARHFFHWAAPATLKEFAWWARTSQREAKSAIEKLGFIHAVIQGWDDSVWLSEEDTRKLQELSPERGSQMFLLPFRDNYLYFRRSMALFIRPGDRDTQVLDWKNRMTSISQVDSIHNNAIVANGMLVGLWEYDPEEAEIVWSIFAELPATAKKALLLQIERLEDFIRRELGDAPLYAMDSGRKRRQRIDALRKQKRD